VFTVLQEETAPVDATDKSSLLKVDGGVVVHTHTADGIVVIFHVAYVLIHITHI